MRSKADAARCHRHLSRSARASSPSRGCAAVDCGTTIEGEFGVGRFARLTREQVQRPRELPAQPRQPARHGAGAPASATRRSGPASRRWCAPSASGPVTRRTGARAPAASAPQPPRRSSRRPARHPGAPRRPRAECRGGRRGHPRAREGRPMTDTMTTTPADPRAARSSPAAPWSIVLAASDLRIRGTDGDRVIVRTRDGEPARRRGAASRPRPASSGSATGRAAFRLGPLAAAHPALSGPRHRRARGPRRSRCVR